MNKLSFALVLLIILGFVSCKTDIDVNAEPTDITIVYGLINPNDTVHYLKINKAFIGEGSALDLAGNASNYNYAADELDVTIEGNGNVYSLIRVINEIPKDAGIFDNNTNVLYKFNEPLINKNAIYTLKIVNTKTGKEVSSETKIVGTLGVSVRKAVRLWNGVDNYLNEPIDVNIGEHIGRVQAFFVFNYNEYYTDGSSVKKEVLMSLGEKLAANSSDNVLNFTLKGSSFFDNIAANVSNPSTIPHFSHRHLDNFTIRLSVAGSELTTYMEAEAPSTTVNQDKPSYTNIIDGVGIFSSRTRYEWKSGYDITSRINFNGETITKLDELGLGFCWSTLSTATAKCPF